MKVQKTFPGFLFQQSQMTEGALVEAKDFQSILDWMRWYLNWFMPAHIYFSGQQGDVAGYGYILSGRNFYLSPRCFWNNTGSLIVGCYQGSNSYDFSYYNPETNNTSNIYTTALQAMDYSWTPFVLYSGGNFGNPAPFRLYVREWRVVSCYDIWADAYLG